MTYPLFNNFEIVRLPEDQNPEFIPFEKAGSPPVLVVSNPLNEEEKSLLSKIMQSINRTTDQNFLLVQLAEKSSGKLADQWFKEESIIISFGVPFSQLGFQLDKTLYRILKMAGKSFLLVDTLSKISGSADLKRKLWSQLKLVNA